jgi:hypothetical protein
MSSGERPSLSKDSQISVACDLVSESRARARARKSRNYWQGESKSTRAILTRETGEHRRATEAQAQYWKAGAA